MGGSFLPRASGSVVGDRVIFPLLLHVVPEHAELVAVSTSLSRRVGLSAPEASSADEPLGAAVVPRCRSGADGCGRFLLGIGGSKGAVLALAVRAVRARGLSQMRALRPSRMLFMQTWGPTFTAWAEVP
jgi:hypothetical protein